MLALHGNKLQGAVQNNLFLISYANVVAVFFEIRSDFCYQVIREGCTLSSPLKGNIMESLLFDISKVRGILYFLLI